MVFGAAFVEGGEVDAHAELLRLLLLHQDWVGDPVRVFDFSNELGIQQSIDFSADFVSLGPGKASHGLFDGSGVLVDF